MIKRNKKSIFICQITENILKVVKCEISSKAKREFVGLESEALSADTDDKKTTERLSAVFKKLEYRNNPVIFCLPRYHATLRYLKVPSQQPQEIEGIVNLQASHYLPYPGNELTTGFQVISTDKNGYSELNLAIVHREIFNRYFNIFKEIGTTELKLVLSSYGLSNLCNYINPNATDLVMAIDIDTPYIELVVLSQNKLLFSRSFKLLRTQPNWERLFIDEINKTQDAYSKEITKEIPKKIILLGAEKIMEEFAEILKKEAGLSAEAVSFAKKLNLSQSLLDKILASDNSFAGIFGLGLEDIPESLNLVPQEVKEVTKRTLQRKEYLRLSLSILGIILLLSFAVFKNLDNKVIYLSKLKAELNKIAEEARPLEEIDKRIKLLHGRSQKKLSSLDMIYELHQAMPSQVNLISLIYEEGNQVVLRGQTPDLNSVFAFVSQLEGLAGFKNFNIKVRYATKKKTQLGEMVEFEIICLKK